MSLFPAYIEDDEILEDLEEELETPKEFGIDFTTGQLTGEIVEGIEAIKVWCYLALRIARYHFFICSWDYGSEIEDLYGQGFSAEHIESEAARMIEDELLPIEFIDDYENGELIELVEAATDDEETEVYRERYLAERKQEYTMSGNRADYKKFIKELIGVGGVKQERVRKEYKRINTYIISSLWGKPSGDIVAQVQQAVDPKDNQGDGEGKAPFWHVVDVYPVNTEEINISAKFELSAGANFETVLPSIEEAISNYFIELNKTWEDTGKNGLIVRALKVAEAMASVENVIDIQDLLLNGSEDNITLHRNTIPIRGAIINVD